MPESFRIWRWLSALALIAVGLVMGASVAGAQDAQAQESGHALASSPAQFHTSPGHFVTPLEPHVAGSSYAAQSTNWSGQISTGTTYSGVPADWVVPTVQPTQYSGASATWIGIDGGPASPGSIIQTGTVQLTGGGATQYAAWYELYPAPPVTVGGVSPGDTMSASIHQDQPEADWTITIADFTTGKHQAPFRSPTPAPATRPSGSRSCRRRWALPSPRSPTSDRRRSRDMTVPPGQSGRRLPLPDRHDQRERQRHRHGGTDDIERS